MSGIDSSGFALRMTNNRHPESHNNVILSTLPQQKQSCELFLQEGEGSNTSHPEALAEGSITEIDLSVSSKPQDDNIDSSDTTYPQNDTDVILSETKDLTTDTSPTVQNDNITYTWLSKDDKLVTLTLEDFVTLGSLIAEYKNSIWSGKYIAFKTAIEQAETLKKLEKIEINYADSNI